MKKIFISLMLIFSLFASPALASAVSINTCPAGAGAGTSDSTVCKDTTSSGKSPIISSLKVVLNILSYVAGIVSVITLMIAGFRMVVGGGNSEHYNSARNTIIYAIIGIAVVVLSQTIVIFVLDKLK